MVKVKLKTCGEVEVLSDLLHASTALSPRKVLLVPNWIGDWVGPRTDMDAVE
jgi:SpoU rRNA methylase family enzyme